jgi:hypothetical protein
MLKNPQIIIVDKINIKLILCQWSGLILLLSGFLQLRIVTVFDTFICALKYRGSLKHECWTLDISMADFLTDLLLWRIYGFAIGTIIISVRNWKVSIYFVNTIIAVMLVFLLFPIRFFHSAFSQVLFSPLNLSEQYLLNYLITGVIYTSVGFLLIFKIK